MRSYRLVGFFLGLLLIAPSAFGEAGAGTTSIAPFDKNFWDPPAKPATPGKIGERSVAEEPDYNTEQRAEALKSCDQYKDKDSKSYRDCYQGYMKRSSQKLKESFDRVERKQAEPFRSTAPSGVPEMEQREPAFGGVDSETEND